MISEDGGAESVSYIDQIPPEILQQIFILDHDDLGTSLVISAICQRWRAVTLLTPELWSSLVVHVSSNCSFPPVPLIATFIGRSNTWPLSLSLIYHTLLHSEEHHPHALEAIFEILLSHFHRWQKVSLNFADLKASIVLPQLEFGTSRGPFLSSVEIHSGGLLSASQGDWISSFLCSSPSIRRFTAFGRWARNYSISWTQLTHLHIENYLPESIAVEILGDAQALTECQFMSLYGARHHTTATSSPVVNRLRSLKIRSRDNLRNFLHGIILPDLQSLDITFSQSPWRLRWNQLEFMSLLTRSACPIRTFILRHPFLSSTNLLQCLRQISPMLTDIKILSPIELEQGASILHSEKIPREVLDMLTYRQGSPLGPLCPGLRSVTFELCIASSDLGVFSEMIESRWRAHHPLSDVPTSEGGEIGKLEYMSVIIKTSQQMDSKRLDGLLGEGLKGSVRFYDPQSRPRYEQ